MLDISVCLALGGDAPPYGLFFRSLIHWHGESRVEGMFRMEIGQVTIKVLSWSPYHRK